MAMKETSKKVFIYLKDHQGENLTLDNIADALDMGIRSVNGCLVGMQRKSWIVREAVDSVDEAGKKVTVKYIRLTAEGAQQDPDAE